jgi:P27 family predicted phage terminase small subunit
MGRQRIPKAILEARGSRITKYGDQRTGDNREHELQAPVCKPRRPPGLSPYAAGKWRYLVGKLMELRILSEIDGDALARYCRELARYRDLEIAYDRHAAAMARTPVADRWHDDRLIALIHKSSTRCDQLGGRFGLSPADRTKIQAEKPPPEKKKKARPAGKARLSMLDGKVSKVSGND